MSVRIKTEDGDLIVSGKGKNGKDGGGDIEWLYYDGSKHAIQVKNIGDYRFPIVLSYVSETNVLNPKSGGVLFVYTSGSEIYLNIKPTDGTIAVPKDTIPESGEPVAFDYGAYVKMILGIPKSCIKEYGISIVNK